MLHERELVGGANQCVRIVNGLLSLQTEPLMKVVGFGVKVLALRRLGISRSVMLVAVKVS